MKAEDCVAQDTDHAVVCVGWGLDTDGKTEYFIVRNSWGATDWGENGYIRLEITAEKLGTCAMFF